MGSRATPPTKRLGDWNAGSVHTTVYRAATDIWVSAFCINQNSGGADMTIDSDSATPPAVVRCAEGISVDDGTWHVNSFVKKGDYWQVNRAGASAVTVLWIPLEP